MALRFILLRTSLQFAQSNLIEPREIQRLAENPCGFLWRVETLGMLCFHRIQIELCLALEVPSLGKISVCPAFCLRSFDVVDQLHERVHRLIAQSMSLTQRWLIDPPANWMTGICFRAFVI